MLVISAGALLLVIGTHGEPQILAQLFAFGLLGAYVITSVSLDVLRWRDGRRGPIFVLGIVATLMLLVPWVTSWFTKWQATLYGGARRARCWWSRSSRGGGGSARGASGSSRPLPPRLRRRS